MCINHSSIRSYFISHSPVSSMYLPFFQQKIRCERQLILVETRVPLLDLIGSAARSAFFEGLRLVLSVATITIPAFRWLN